MTLAEFVATQTTLVCNNCKKMGQLATKYLPNNNGYKVICQDCFTTNPLDGITFLKQRGPKRRVKSDTTDLNKLWSEWGDQCAGCGTTSTMLQRLGIGQHMHHAPPLATVPDESYTTLIPMCAICHGHLTLVQRYRSENG
jgi:hypothetical protein